jgi:hypothetical protein
MPIDKNFKRLVRRRAEETGERYSAARAALDHRPKSRAGGPTTPTPTLSAEDGRLVDEYFDEWKLWLEHFRAAGRRLRDWPEGRQAWESIAVPVEAMQRAALLHPNPAVRRQCLGVLDHVANDASMPVFRAALSDPVPRVRLTALHGFGCVRCKTWPLVSDEVVPELLRLLREDPSAKVRHAAAVGLAVAAQTDAPARAAMTRAAEEDPDELVRALCAAAVAGERNGIRSRKALRRRSRSRG